MLRILTVAALALGASASSEWESWENDEVPDEWMNMKKTTSRRKLQTGFEELLIATTYYDVNGSEYQTTSMPDDTVYSNWNGLKLPHQAALSWKGKSPFLDDDKTGLLPQRTCNCREDKKTDFPFLDATAQREAMCGTALRPTGQLLNEILNDACVPRYTTQLDLGGSGATSSQVYNNLGGVGNFIGDHNPDSTNSLDPLDLQRNHLNFVYLKNVGKALDRACWSTNGVADTCFKPVSMRMDNVSVYKPWNPTQNGFVGGGNMFQVNLIPIFDVTGQDQPFDIQNTSYSLSPFGFKCDGLLWPTSGLCPNYGVEDENTSPAAGKYIKALFTKLGIYNFLDLKAENSNSVSIMYRFFDESTGKALELEEVYLSFYDFDQMWADGAAAVTRESMFVLDYDALLISDGAALEKEFSHKYWERLHDPDVDFFDAEWATKIVPNRIIRNLVNQFILKQTLQGVFPKDTLEYPDGDEYRNVDLRSETNRPRGWQEGTWRARWNTEIKDGGLGYTGTNWGSATVSNAAASTSFGKGVALRAKSLGTGKPTGIDSSGKPTSIGYFKPLSFGGKATSPTDTPNPRERNNDQYLLQAAYAKCLENCLTSRCTFSDVKNGAWNGVCTERAYSEDDWNNSPSWMRGGGDKITCDVGCQRTAIPYDFGNPDDADVARSTVQMRDRSATFVFRDTYNITFAYKCEIGFDKRDELDKDDPSQVKDSMFIAAVNPTGAAYVNQFRDAPSCNQNSDPLCNPANRDQTNGVPTYHLPSEPNGISGSSKLVGKECYPSVPPCSKYRFYDPAVTTISAKDQGRAFVNTAGGRNFLISGATLLLPPSMPSAPPPPPPRGPDANSSCLTIQWEGETKNGFLPKGVDGLETVEYKVVHPVRSATKWYNSHPRVTYVPITATSPRPTPTDTDSWWLRTTAWFEPDPRDSRVDMNNPTTMPKLASVAFYAYGYPYDWSANTGFEQGNRTVLTTVVDQSECPVSQSSAKPNICYSVLYIIDKPWDLSGGKYQLDVYTTGDALAFPHLDVRLQDDTWKPVTYPCEINEINGNENNDPTTASCNSNPAQFTFKWSWNECCTDGFVASYLPDPTTGRSYSYTLAASNIEGVYGGTYYIEFDPISAKPVTHKIPMHMTRMEPYKGIQFRAVDCVQHCAVHTNCGHCAADINCAWGGGTCKPIHDQGAFYQYNDILVNKDYTGDPWTTYGEQCEKCENVNSMTDHDFKAHACVQLPGCGWAPFEKYCVSGTENFHSKCGGVACTIVQWEPSTQCYKASWNDKRAFQPSGKRFTWHGINPVTHWKGHATSSENRVIEDENDATQFYAYGPPPGSPGAPPSSSNSGISSMDSMVIYLISDRADHVYLVTVIDSAEDSTGGKLAMKMHVTGDTLNSANILLKDDPTDTLNYVTATDGAGDAELAWNWNPGETDGMVFGPLPIANWTARFDVDVTKTEGLDLVRLASYSATGEVSFIGTSISKFGAAYGMGMLESMECNEYCMQYTSCTECVKDERCNFARQQGGCVSKKAYIFDNGCPAPAKPANRLFLTASTATSMAIKIRMPDKINFNCPCVYHYQVVIYTMDMDFVTVLDHVPMRTDKRFSFAHVTSGLTANTVYQAWVYACSQDECGDTPLIEEVYTSA
jgi:hypothetical protein